MKVTTCDYLPDVRSSLPSLTWNKIEKLVIRLDSLIEKDGCFFEEWISTSSIESLGDFIESNKLLISLLEKEEKLDTRKQKILKIAVSIAQILSNK